MAQIYDYSFEVYIRLVEKLNGIAYPWLIERGKFETEFLMEKLKASNPKLFNKFLKQMEQTIGGDVA
jgi:hypothetical protein